MPALFVPYVAAAVLLVVAGAPKVLDPEPTARAAASARLPAGAGLVRLFGAAEAALGIVVLGVGGPVPALLVAATYAGFAAVVVRGLVRGDMESCGCFNGEDSPPTVLHVVLDLGLAGAAVTVALTAAAHRSWWSLATAEVDVALAIGLLGLTVASLVYLVLARLPQVTLPVDREAVA